MDTRTRRTYSLALVVILLAAFTLGEAALRGCTARLGSASVSKKKRDDQPIHRTTTADSEDGKTDCMRGA
jgi:hypothetical protein